MPRPIDRLKFDQPLPGDDPAGSGISRLKPITIGLIIVQLVAAGLISWQIIRQKIDLTLATQQREALAVAERIAGNIDEARAALRLGARGGVGSLAIETDSEGIERAFRAIPLGSRARLADTQSRELAVSIGGTGTGLTDSHIIVTQKVGSAVWGAEASSATWLPDPTTGRVFLLSDLSHVQVRGTGDLANRFRNAPVDVDGTTRTVYDGTLFERTALACAPVGGTTLAACSAVRISLLSPALLISLSITGLLFLSSLLALISYLTASSKLATGTRSVSDAAPEAAPDLADLDASLLAARTSVLVWTLESDQVEVRGFLARSLGVANGASIPTDSLLSLIHQEDRDKLRRGIYQAVQQGAVTGTVRMSLQGTGLWMELRGCHVAGDPEAPSKVAVLVLDITERKRNEEKIRAAERRLREAIEGFSGPFALWDSRKRLLYWNRAFARDFNIDAGRLRPGASYDAVSLEISEKSRKEQAVNEDSQAREIELADGRWMRLVERGTMDGGFLSLGIDITPVKQHEDRMITNEKKLKRLIQDLERSEGRSNVLARKYGEEKAKAEQASKTKGAFLANMSHELRTPLNAINGFSEILVNELYGPLGDDRYKGYAKDILLSGQHLLDMINDILDMAKIEAGKMSINPRPIDPVEPVDAAVRMIRRKAEDKSIALDFVYDEDVPEIEADHRAIKQMVLNLVSNAIKFTDSGGKITVSVALEQANVAVHVADTGIGISEEDLPRLAKPFEQARPDKDQSGGTGLGLALTKSFAEMHGGYFDIRSKLGEGTTVSFYLPVAASKTASTEEAA